MLHSEVVYGIEVERSRTLKRTIPTAIAAALVLVAVTGSVLALAPDSEVMICVDKQTGAMRQESRRNRCDRATENRLTLNQRGPAGPVGASGPAGPAGASGPAGPAGAAGSNGLSKAYYRLLDADLYLNTDASTVVGRISDVAPGTYLVFFNTDVLNWGQPQYFGCGFEVQEWGGARKIWIPQDSTRGGEYAVFESRWNYSKNGFVTVPGTGGAIEVHCKVDENPEDIFALSNGSMIALAVNEVTATARVFPNP